jgi:hypothetical protein
MVIANRLLKLRLGSSDIDVPIRIYAPKANGIDWTCHYEIGWPEGTRKSYAAGIDAIQVLHLALQKIGVDVYTSKHHESKALSWEKPGRGYGFPVSKNIRDLLEGDDAKYL